MDELWGWWVVKFGRYLGKQIEVGWAGICVLRDPTAAALVTWFFGWKGV